MAGFLDYLVESCGKMVASKAERVRLQAYLDHGVEVSKGALRLALMIATLPHNERNLYEVICDSFGAAAKAGVDLNSILDDVEGPIASRVAVLVKDGRDLYRAFLGCDEAMETFNAELSGPSRLADVSRRLIKLSVELESVRKIFSATSGVAIDVYEDASEPRKTKTGPLNAHAVLLSLAWEVMTNTDCQYPNKSVEGGLFGTRPKYDDAYFVFIMLNLTADVKDRAVAETAIKHVLKLRKKWRAKPVAGLSEDMVKVRLRKKWEELKLQ